MRTEDDTPEQPSREKDSEMNVIETETEIASQGKIFITVKNLDGTTATLAVKNKVLRTGRSALAKSVANQFSTTYQFYISRVLFGSNGTLGGSPRFIDDARTGLFGPTTLTKPVIASIDPDVPYQVTFTTTVNFDELVGQTINEMALEMANGDVFSMATFGDISKTSSMSLVFNWRLNFIG